ncbi:hypothetical protein LPB137_00645 [Poseidonibacter parvus]|uniref:Uncharacterized protein n=1 Tax=Poseidonibacter parvus TaxID=1850254 RepID=A0A1P8KIT5_9BACT|nr:hypothetical protein [Poseidonibacter parvus]APW64444.1 hypothetical protein LPB137_00645 [Poseidonibacter parvus]
MIKIILVFLTLFISLNTLHAEDSEFIQQQELFLKVKTIIQEEESIARAYENFILNEKKLPTTFAQLVTDEYLDSGFTLTPFVDGETVSVNDFGFRKEINNRLKGSSLEEDESIQRLYESDLFRKKTYFYDRDEIGIKLEDEFVNHLYFLSSTAGFNLIKCGISPKKKYCWNKEDTDENVIYIYQEDAQTNLLMYYSVDNFKTGPIIITNDTSLHITSDEFNSIPKGALLYDTEAVKYIKTRDSIEVVK